ncbi:MAG: trans-aconitate 2-methyltransferase, partial [Vicinamibacterales bacterium]
EHVLDLGCGSGLLTADLLARLPGGRVTCVDLSANMLTAAREELNDRFPRRVSFIRAEASQLPFAAAFDAVFSTATFHWVPDHRALFAGIRIALVPGGRLVAQCGAMGNIERFNRRCRELMRSRRFAVVFGEWDEAWRFPESSETEALLTRAGFVDVRVGVEEAPVRFSDPEAFKSFVATAVVRGHLARLATPGARSAFLDGLVEAGAASPDGLTLDYRRLNIEARRDRAN